jgi:Carbohydrate binding module (family 6)
VEYIVATAADATNPPVDNGTGQAFYSFKATATQISLYATVNLATAAADSFLYQIAGLSPWTEKSGTLTSGFQEVLLATVNNAVIGQNYVLKIQRREVGAKLDKFRLEGGTFVDGVPGPAPLPNFMPAGYTGLPYGGVVQTIPGKIEMERYDLGGEGVAYHDGEGKEAFNQCGFNRADAPVRLACSHGAGAYSDKLAGGCGPAPDGDVYLGWITAGEWYKYTVNVTEPGTYVIAGREGVAANNVTVSFVFSPTINSGPVKLPSTQGCNNYEAYHIWAVHNNLAEITLPAGRYVLTINMVAVAMNIDYFTFTKKP